MLSHGWISGTYPWHVAVPFMQFVDERLCPVPQNFNCNRVRHTRLPYIVVIRNDPRRLSEDVVQDIDLIWSFTFREASCALPLRLVEETMAALMSSGESLHPVSDSLLIFREVIKTYNVVPCRLQYLPFCWRSPRFWASRLHLGVRVSKRSKFRRERTYQSP